MAIFFFFFFRFTDCTTRRHLHSPFADAGHASFDFRFMIFSCHAASFFVILPFRLRLSIFRLRLFILFRRLLLSAIATMRHARFLPRCFALLRRSDAADDAMPPLSLLFSRHAANADDGWRAHCRCRAVMTMARRATLMPLMICYY